MDPSRSSQVTITHNCTLQSIYTQHLWVGRGNTFDMGRTCRRTPTRMLRFCSLCITTAVACIYTRSLEEKNHKVVSSTGSRSGVFECLPPLRLGIWRTPAGHRQPLHGRLGGTRNTKPTQEQLSASFHMFKQRDGKY